MLEQKDIKRGLMIILLNGLWYHNHEVIKDVKT